MGPVSLALADTASTAAAADAAYTQTINQRADKIVATLGIDDPVKAGRVRDLVARQYRDLNEIHLGRDAASAVARARTPVEGASLDPALAVIRSDSEAKQFKLHFAFLGRLSAELTNDQVDKVKDGLTYSVLRGTYKHYLELYPKLTGEQQRHLLALLTEAREFAMDGGSSDEKHGWFGKYKGRINNYLSAAGFDAKQAEREWNALQKPKAN